MRVSLGGGRIQMQEGQGAKPSEGAVEGKGLRGGGVHASWVAGCFRSSLDSIPSSQHPGQSGNLEGGRGGLVIPGPCFMVEKTGLMGAWRILPVLLCDGYLGKIISIHMLGGAVYSGEPAGEVLAGLNIQGISILPSVGETLTLP